MTKSAASQLEELEQQIETKKKKKAQLKAQLKSQKRRDETRRKILIGAAVESLSKHDTGGLWMLEENRCNIKTLEQVLDKVITNKADRKFLGLKNEDPFDVRYRRLKF